MESLSLTRSPLIAFAPLSTSLSHRGLCPPLHCLIKDKSKLQYHSLQLTKQTKWPLSGNYLVHGMFDQWPRNQTAGLVSASAAGSEPDSIDSSNALQPILSSLNAFYRFSRPHTVIGTALSIVSVSLLAVESLSDMSPLFFTGVLQAVVAALFMNVYIVGLNQVFDIEIDKVNKPNLPLASGEYSLSTGVAIVSTFAIMSFGVGWLVGSWPLFWALFISFILGTAYSVNMPFLRWKRFAVVAALCILAVRAVIVQLAFFLHIKMFVFRRPASFSKPLIFATAFMTFFSVVIALFKDIPDIEGDRIFGIRSFSVRLGQKPVFWICVYLLEIAYSVAIFLGATSSCLWSKLLTILGHAVLASILWNRARSLDLTSKSAITSFYMFIWKVSGQFGYLGIGAIWVIWIQAQAMPKLSCRQERCGANPSAANPGPGYFLAPLMAICIDLWMWILRKTSQHVILCRILAHSSCAVKDGISLLGDVE